jgi:hypothetical protein
VKNLTPTGIRSPDRPARSQSLYQLSYPAQTEIITAIKRKLNLAGATGNQGTGEQACNRQHLIRTGSDASNLLLHNCTSTTRTQETAVKQVKVIKMPLEKEIRPTS